MNTIMSHISFLFTGAMLMLLLMGLGLAVFVPIVDRWSRRFFIL